ncbi:dipeptidyl peptidase 4-like isoform X2 [Oppia nitens]|uniref:dipeptidyl peptidase 4-like isoform X2 n=1 Tax=Oppia nitens TaxID=1686743 RepID=UPI0023DA6A26|nr:dipeptidyl peptidase 4-like isoform X2 [Oppia nitens]
MSAIVKPVESVPALPHGEMDALLLGRIKELPVVDIESSNWKGVTIAVMVILAICGAIVSSVVLINPDIQTQFSAKTYKEKLKLDQILQGVYSTSAFNGSWISDYELIFRDISGNLVKLNLNDSPPTTITLVHNSVFRQNVVQKYSLSTDKNYLLLVYDMKKLFRHSYIAKHKIYNISSEDTEILYPPNDQTITDLQFASWGPKPNSSQLIFVAKNTIYYKESVSAKTAKIVINGNNLENIFNGIPDWVYEEEVLSSSNAIWWSPDGSKICFAQFNDTNVDVMQYPWYGTGIDNSNLYTKTIQIRYPKAGRANPKIKLFVANLDSDEPFRSLQEVIPPTQITNDDYYFTSISWIDNQKLSVTWLKRVQNYAIVSICLNNQRNWICNLNLVQQSEGKGWVDASEAPLFSGNDYFVRLPNNQTKEEYRHIARVTQKMGEPTFITEGLFDTLQLLAISRNEISGVQYLYYAATGPAKPEERHIFKVMITSTNTKTSSQCLTCNLGDKCLHNSAIFSQNAKYYILECNGPDIPNIELRKSDDNSLIKTLQTNDRLKNLLSNKILPKIEKMVIPIHNNNLSVMLYIPPELNKHQIVKYPLLIQVYGGPGSQMVTDKFQVNWGTYLASTKNIIYCYIDGRGSGNQGDRLMHQLYHNLGTVEVEDQIAVAKYLRDKYNYINKDAIGIWGWSYGGYATALALAMDVNNPVFSCGVSVAPVTSWLLYDSVYTERYMGLPKDNMESYLKSDVLNRAHNFKGKKFLLCHGSADDNVHLQQSMVLMKALTNANVMFQTQVYPDENHSLSGVKPHLYQTMETFWDECFQTETFVEDIGLRRRRVVKQSQSL